MIAAALARRPSARLLLRPNAFIEAPFGRDGQALRLAGGLLWFSAIEVLACEGGKRFASALVPVERLEAFLDEIGRDHAAHARETLARLTAPRGAISLGDRIVRLDQPQLMAILNITPDSFSDGGAHGGDAAAAADRGVAMAAEGAALIDLGGESTRPGAQPVWEGDEIARVMPVADRLRAAGVALSIDTRKAAVMEAVLGSGPAIVNDVSALGYDARSAEVVARFGTPIVLMHHQGSPETMQRDPSYEDALVEVYEWLEERIAVAVAAGIDRARILIDPGIGFGKALRHNLQILNGLSLFHGLGCPIVLGASRKRTIGALSNEAPVEKRLGGSVALAIAGASQGVQLLRVHDAFETAQALRVWRGLRDEALTPPA